MKSNFEQWSLHLTQEHRGEAITTLLRQHVEPQPSWKVVKGWVRSGKVFLDGRRINDPGERYKKGALLEVRMSAPRRAPMRDLEEEAVVFIDRDLVVVNKPTLMLTYDQHKLEKDTLEFRVRGTIQRLRKGKASEPVYPIYAVDERASGLVMFARSPEMQKKMQEQWTQGLMRRSVCAVVAGAPAAQIKESLMVHDRGDGYRGSLPDTVRKAPNAQKAVTDIRLLQQEDDLSCVWCRALSNRPHQVRIHLSELQAPIFGDYVYQKAAENSGSEPFWRKLPKVHRMMLHVTDLRFRHPRTELMVQVRGGLPKDFKRVLKELGLDEVRLPQPESLPNEELRAIRRREEEERRAAERAEQEAKKNRTLPPWLASKRGYVPQQRPTTQEASGDSERKPRRGPRREDGERSSQERRGGGDARGPRRGNQERSSKDRRGGGDHRGRSPQGRNSDAGGGGRGPRTRRKK